MYYRLCRLLALALAGAVLSGCMSPRAFVDPSFPKVSYDDVKKRSTPLRLRVSVEFQRNGEPFPKADATLRDNTERVLRASGVIVPVSDPGDGEMKVVVNNIADRGAAAARGFATGFTFGLVGTTVTDAYEMSVTITTHGKTITRSAVKHALHTAIGNTDIPAGLEPIPINIAFQRVLEQMLLRVLQDVQNTGELAWLRAPSGPASLLAVAPSFREGAEAR
jgi:hypothetical protein